MAKLRERFCICYAHEYRRGKGKWLGLRCVTRVPTKLRHVGGRNYFCKNCGLSWRVS